MTLIAAGLGILGVLLSSFFAHRTARSAAHLAVSEQFRVERTQRLKVDRFQVYMQLLDLNQLYFWVTVSGAAENIEPSHLETRSKIFRLGWEIAENLRRSDDLPEVEEILNILFSETAFASAAERHDALGKVIDAIGVDLTPRYSGTLRKISRDNLMAADGFLSNRNTAPCSFDPIKEAGRRESIRQRLVFDARKRGQTFPEESED